MKTGKILDPIHGTIDITEIEKFIINQKLFGRLRKIKQNTLLNYVFPGANHTRFEHSIGVMHLAEEIYNKSNENVEITHLKNEKYSDKKEYKTIRELIRNDEFKGEVLLQELRLAALLHDIGHGPTSHKFDSFTIKGNELLEILKVEEKFKDYIENFKTYIEEKGREKRIEHELVSCIFIIDLIDELKKHEYLTKNSKKVRDKINVKNIIKMIEPSFLPDHEIEIGDEMLTDYFNSIISSFPFDADRMDYLYRDSFYSGVKYGFYDLSRILMSVLPVKNKDNRYTLGIKESGLGSIIRFIQSRNHLYSQVYFHKTNCATNTMLDFVFRKMKGKSVFGDINNYEAYKNFYLLNSDEYFFNTTLKSLLNKEGCNTCGEGCIENDVLDELMERKLWKRIYEEKIYVNDSNTIDNEKFDESNLKKIKKGLEKEGKCILEYYSKNKGLKGYKKSKIVIIKKEAEDPLTWDDLIEENDELKFLNQTNVLIKRIYLRKTFDNAREYEDIKKEIIEKLETEEVIKK
ncbi:HD domain-containing protein [uncultured Tenacibaculum sp.]|uniref:HD domain-containing protein n=1 Tax=uncultured Tenacibaculum sp. TaxID=174713 RepID=UPI002629AE6F|nr:HD domain-containing protein [uncultured Tenacibaculum sp.]